MRGGLLVALASVVARGASFIAQLVLGRLLLPEDFGLFAIALTFTTLAAAANSVLRSFLVDGMKRGWDIEALYRLVVWTTLAVTVVFSALSPALAAPFDEDGLVPVLLALNLTMPLQVLPALGMARLTHELRYRDLSRLWTISAVARQGVTVAAALAGMGAMSFVLGVVVGSASEWMIARRATGPSPSWFGTLRLDQVQRQAGDLRVLPLSILVLALWINGDYAAAGLFETALVVGVYFFAYQLTTALTQPFTLAVSSVLLPRFHHDHHDQAEQDAFRLTMLLVPLLSGLPFGLLAVLAAPLTNLVWGGEWDPLVGAGVGRRGGGHGCRSHDRGGEGLGRGDGGRDGIVRCIRPRGRRANLRVVDSCLLAGSVRLLDGLDLRRRAGLSRSPARPRRNRRHAGARFHLRPGGRAPDLHPLWRPGDAHLADGHPAGRPSSC